MTYMLDTNMCIYIIKRKPLEVIDRLRRTRISEVCVSSVTAGELFFGVAKSARPDRNRIALAQFLAPLEIAPFDSEAAEAYGAIRAGLERKGAPIGALDTLIAAHAFSLGCTLVTNNEREFTRVPELRIENWTA